LYTTPSLSLTFSNMSERVLRKRAAPPAAPERPTKKKAAPKPKKGAVAKAVDAVKETVARAEETVKTAVATNGTSSKAPEVGDAVDIATFGGDFETQDGKKVTFKEILDESESGVVFFTYPKASTPGW
jgi:peroxiredoxin Q/BCP